jgi:glycosyltransferase involved in cell wall biosynthesis
VAGEWILIVHVITGLTCGGAQNALYRLLTAQADPSTSHVVSLTDEGVFGAKLRAAGIGVTCLDMHPSLPPVRAFLRLVRILRRLRPVVVQTWMYHADLVGGLASRIAGVPVCWGIRNSDVSSSRTKFATRCVVRLCAVMSHVVPTTIVSCSKHAADVHRALGYAERFVIIPNGIALDRFLPHREMRPPLRKKLGLSANAAVVGYVGRKDPLKDHPKLIEAFEELAVRDPSLRLVLVGSGMDSEDPYLQDMLAGRSISAQVVALGQRDDVEDVMPAFDVFVLSSFSEAFPNVVVEAMACGIPCVVTDVGDAAEIVGDTGWIVPPGDSSSLAGAMRQALDESSHQRSARGHRARQRVEQNYHIGRMVQAYRKVWSEVSGEGAEPCAV